MFNVSRIVKMHVCNLCLWCYSGYTIMYDVVANKSLYPYTNSYVTHQQWAAGLKREHQINYHPSIQERMICYREMECLKLI